MISVLFPLKGGHALVSYIIDLGSATLNYYMVTRPRRRRYYVEVSYFFYQELYQVSAF